MNDLADGGTLPGCLVPLAELNEPALGGLEAVHLAEAHCELSNLFFVS